jgi:hypothetical protein
MRKSLFAASIAAIALIPAAVHAQSACERQRTDQVVGTVAGAGVGGVLGNAVAGRDDRTLGTIVGAVGGAIIGNQITRPARDCSHAYGFYDADNRWHANRVNSSNARGYYDRDGGWIVGAPNGHYGDEGRWIVNPGSAAGEGWQSSDGGWIPASANGYYDLNDQWVAGSATGAWDQGGRWQPGNGPSSPLNRRSDSYGFYDDQSVWHAAPLGRAAATGYYNRKNIWVEGRPEGHFDQRRNWVPHRDDGSPSGSYDDQNRWIPESTRGHYEADGQWSAGIPSGTYDTRGRWVPRRGDGSLSGSYDSQDQWTPGDSGGSSYGQHGRPIAAQLDQLESQIRSAGAQRSLSREEAGNALRELDDIRFQERTMARDGSGALSERNASDLQVRINRINDRLRFNPQ